MDGSSSKKGNRFGVILESPNKVILEQSLRIKFQKTNNQAEYEALLAKLRLAKEVRAIEWRIPDQRSTDDKILPHGYSA